MKLKWWISLLVFVQAIELATAQVPLQTYQAVEDRIAAGKDTIYVVNLWATWCKPCVQELPSFDSLQLAYPNIKVLLLSLDFVSKHKDVVVPFVEKRAIQSEVIHLDEPNANAIIDRVSQEWSGAIPVTYIKTAEQQKMFFEQEFTFQTLEKAYLNYIRK